MYLEVNNAMIGGRGGDVRPEYLSIVHGSGDDVRAVAVDVKQDTRAFEGFWYRCYTAGLTINEDHYSVYVSYPYTTLTCTSPV